MPHSPDPRRLTVLPLLPFVALLACMEQEPPTTPSSSVDRPIAVASAASSPARDPRTDLAVALDDASTRLLPALGPLAGTSLLGGALQQLASELADGGVVQPGTLQSAEAAAARVSENATAQAADLEAIRLVLLGLYQVAAGTS